MAKILTFPKDRASLLVQQPVETTSDDPEFVVFEADELLSFSRHNQSERQTSHSQTIHDHDWSNQELASIYRVKHLLDQAKMRTELDRGVSDEGDPWCVFCNGNGEVFIHLSRIDGSYWLDSPKLTAPLYGSSFDTLVSGFTSLSQEGDAAQAEAETHKRLVRLRSSNTLVLHPSVMLAALVWSLYFGSEEILLLAPQDDALGENAIDPEIDEADAGLLHEASHDLKNGALTASVMTKGDEAPWNDLQTHDLQKSLLTSGSQSHLGMMLGLGSIAVASGLVSDGQWKEIFSSVLQMDDEKDTQTTLEEDGASGMYVMSMLTQSIDLVANFIVGHDAEYTGEASEGSLGETETAPINLIVTKLAELFGLNEVYSYEDFDSLEVFQNELKVDAGFSDIQSEYAVLEGTDIFPQETMAKGDGANNLLQPGIITKLFESLVRDSDLAAFEFGGTQYFVDFSLELLKAGENGLLEQVLSDSEQVLTTATIDAAPEPIDAPITPIVDISDTASASLFPTFDARAKEFLFDIVAREDVNFITSPTSFIFFDLGAYVEPGTEISKMTWQTDDGMTVSLLGAKADFLDYGFL